MERFYRILFLVLFVLGVVGAAASADHTDSSGRKKTLLLALVDDIHLVNEVNALNDGRWNLDASTELVHDVNPTEELLAKRHDIENK